jgi:hypothetical protein
MRSRSVRMAAAQAMQVSVVCTSVFCADQPRQPAACSPCVYFIISSHVAAERSGSQLDLLSSLTRKLVGRTCSAVLTSLLVEHHPENLRRLLQTQQVEFTQLLQKQQQLEALLEGLKSRWSQEADSNEQLRLKLRTLSQVRPLRALYVVRCAVCGVRCAVCGVRCAVCAHVCS